MTGTSRVGKPLALALAAVISLSLLAAPSSAEDRTEPRSANGPLATAKRVRIVDFSFRPRRVEIPRGTRVRWVNRGAVAHTSTSRTGIWDSGTLASGEVFSRVFKRTGTFRYVCTIHSSMRGKIVVT